MNNQWDGSYDATYSAPHHHQSPTPAQPMDMPPAVPEDVPTPRATDPFMQDDPAMPMQMPQTRTMQRRTSPISTQKPYVPARPIKQTSLQQSSSQPTLAQPKVNAPATTQKSFHEGKTTRIVSRITPASHEAEVEEPAKMELPQVVAPLRANGFPSNPLR